jgi:hypothetical protein
MVIVLTAIIPFMLTGVESFFTHADISASIFARWFIFSAIGLRLFIAGLVQLIHPDFTLHKIFNIQDVKSFALVQELGIYNATLGICALLTPIVPQYGQCIAIIAGIYFGAAGLLHACRKAKSEKEYIAMVSDFIIAAIVLLTLL